MSSLVPIDEFLYVIANGRANIDASIIINNLNINSCSKIFGNLKIHF